MIEGAETGTRTYELPTHLDPGLSGIDMLSIDSTADDSHDTLFPSIIVVARKGFASELDD